MRQNLHTHSTYCDGKDQPEEMIQTAIAEKFDILGFSGHGHCIYDDASMSQQGQAKYIDEIRRLQKQYADEIQIYLGIEQDILGRVPNPRDFDYIIGSAHFVEHEGQFMSVDYSEEMMCKILHEWFHDDFLEYAKTYYQNVRMMKDWDEVDIIGHLDLLTKYNEGNKYFDFENPKYVSIACNTIDALANKIFEVNTGAIARGYRTSPYPYKNLLAYMQEKNIRICLNSDCHDRTKLACNFQESLEMIRSVGYGSMVILTSDGFKDLSLEAFQ